MKNAWMAAIGITAALLTGCTTSVTQATSAIETSTSTMEETEPVLASEAKSLESADPVYVVSSETTYTRGQEDQTVAYTRGDAGEVLVRTTYNLMGADPDEGRTVLFTYDASGVMTSAKGSGYDIDQTVDEKNETGLPTRVSRIDNALGQSWTYDIEYYDDGSLKKYTVTDDAGDRSVYFWDEAGWFAAANTGGYESPIAFSVAEDGSTILGAGVPGNGLEVTYTYDDQGRIQLKTRGMSSDAYSFDENDNAIAITRDGTTYRTFEYEQVQPSAWLAVTAALATPGDLLNTTLTPEAFMASYWDFSAF